MCLFQLALFHTHFLWSHSSSSGVCGFRMNKWMRMGDALFRHSVSILSVSIILASSQPVWIWDFHHRYRANPPYLLLFCLIWWAYMCISQRIIGFPHASVAVTACLTAHEIMVESPVSDWLTSFLMHRLCARLCNKHHKEERTHVFSNETKTFSTYCSLKLLSMCDVLFCFMKMR